MVSEIRSHNFTPFGAYKHYNTETYNNNYPYTSYLCDKIVLWQTLSEDKE